MSNYGCSAWLRAGSAWLTIQAKKKNLYKKNKSSFIGHVLSNAKILRCKEKKKTLLLPKKWILEAWSPC